MKRCVFIIVGILTVCISGCGYYFAGKGGSLPSGIKTLAVPFFTNDTFEAGIENIFTYALTNEFLKRGGVKIEKEEESDAVVTGTIKSFTTYSISFDERDSVLEYRATVTLDVSLKRNHDGAILWESSDLSGNQEYAVSQSITITDNNKRDAIRKIAEDLAEDVYNMIFEDF